MLDLSNGHGAQASALQGARHRGTGLARAMGQWDGHHGAHRGWAQDGSSDRWEPAAHPIINTSTGQGVSRGLLPNPLPEATSLSALKTSKDGGPSISLVHLSTRMNFSLPSASDTTEAHAQHRDLGAQVFRATSSPKNEGKFHQATIPRSQHIPQSKLLPHRSQNQEEKPNPPQGHAPQSTKGFLLLCQINVALTQRCTQTSSRIPSASLIHSQNHLIPIYNVQYMV